MSFGKVVAALLVVAAVALGVGGGATWWFMRGASPIDTAEAAAKSEPEPEPDPRAYKYVSLEKVIVMLRGMEGEPAPHYLAVDLVFKTPEEQEREAREQLPLLKSIAVKSLSKLTMDAASKITVEDLTATVAQAYANSYASERLEQPFVDVMIGKFIVE